MNTAKLRFGILALAIIALGAPLARAAWRSEYIGEDLYPSDMVVTPDGRCLVAYYKKHANPPSLFCAVRVAGANPGQIAWQPTLVATLNHRPVIDEVKFVSDAQGGLHLYYSEWVEEVIGGVPGKYYHVLKTDLNGTQWTAPTRVLSRSFTDKTDEEHEFHFDITTGRYPGLLHERRNYSLYPGGLRGPVSKVELEYQHVQWQSFYGEPYWQYEPIFAENTGVHIRSAIKMDGADRGHLLFATTYGTGGNNDLYYLQQPGMPALTVYYEDRYDSPFVMELDRDGAPKILSSLFNHLAPSEPRTLRYIEKAGSSWNGVVIASDSGSGAPEPIENGRTLTFDARSNRPHLVYKCTVLEGYNQHQEINYAWQNPDSSGAFQVEPAVAETGPGQSVSMATLCLDGQETPLLLYSVADQGRSYLSFAHPNKPRLDWTGEIRPVGDYLTDGVDPDTGYFTSPFKFRVKYRDFGNREPREVRLYILKNESPYVDYRLTRSGSGSYLDGCVYEAYATMLPRGNDYSYYFTAITTDGQPATGAPTQARPGPVVLNTAPKLLWTGEPGYGDGVGPDSVDIGLDVVFRVNYQDADSDMPSTVYLHLLNENGTPVELNGVRSPFPMREVRGPNQTYRSGVTYQYARRLPRGCYYYGFAAKDETGAAATGAPVDDWRSLCVTGLKIGGFVKDLAGQGWAGIQVDLAGAETKNTTTDAKGGYMFEVAQPGQYRAWVGNQRGLVFRTDPGGQAEYSYPSLNTSLYGQNFRAQGLRISGRVTRLALGAPQGLSGVVVKACAASGLPVVIRSVTTDIQGRYTLEVAPGRYNVIPSKTGYKFDPAVRIYSVNGIYANQDYTATAVTP